MEEWQRITAILGGLGAGIAFLSAKLGQAVERRRRSGEDCEAATVADRLEANHKQTRDLIIAVKDGDRALLRELREGFTAEMRELRAMEARQNELLAGLAADSRALASRLPSNGRFSG